jgi:hypothetical protein
VRIEPALKMVSRANHSTRDGVKRPDAVRQV